MLYFNKNLDAKLMCEIYKRALLSTARDQFGIDSASRKLQKDNDPKHKSKLTTKWRVDNGVGKN